MAWREGRQPEGDVGRRKRLRKAAQCRFGDVPMEWIGGRLYFAGTEREVPDVDHVPKAGREAVGRAANPTAIVRSWQPSNKVTVSRTRMYGDNRDVY